MIGETTARVPGRRSRPAKPVTRRAAPSAVRRSARPSRQADGTRGAPAGLLDQDRKVGAPGDVHLVAHLDLIEHDRIDDPPAVFPAVDPFK